MSERYVSRLRAGLDPAPVAYTLAFVRGSFKVIRDMVEKDGKADIGGVTYT